jgi:hypothetical protein
MRPTGILTAAVTILSLVALAACNGGTEADAPLGPGDEIGTMRLTTATPSDTEIWSFCDPVVLPAGTFERTCDVPALQRLMIGHGNLAASPETQEQEWQASTWKLFVDGHQVDLAAFGTLPDSNVFDQDVGEEVSLRLWSVTLLNPSPGEHTLRYMHEQMPAGDAPVGTQDMTWTFTVLEP